MTTQQAKTSGWAIAAIVLTFLCAQPFGLICGIVALVKIGNSNGQLTGKALAIIAIVMPVLMVPIFGILAAIAIPNFIRYQLRSKTTEAKVVLGGIKTSQESFRAEYDQYAPTRATPAEVPGTVKASWDADACPSTCSRESVGACTEFACVGYEPAGMVYYQYACATRPAAQGVSAEFACVAVGDLDGDGNPGVFIYGTANGSGETLVAAPIPAIAAEYCTGEIPAGEVWDCNPNVY